MPKKQGLTCFGIDSVDFAAQADGKIWDNVQTEHEALEIIRKQGDIRKGDAYAYNSARRKLITRPCKLGGEFKMAQSTTLYMFGEEVAMNEDDKNTGKNTGGAAEGGKE